MFAFFSKSPSNKLIRLTLWKQNVLREYTYLLQLDEMGCNTFVKRHSSQFVKCRMLKICNMFKKYAIYSFSLSPIVLVYSKTILIFPVCIVSYFFRNTLWKGNSTSIIQNDVNSYHFYNLKVVKIIFVRLKRDLILRSVSFISSIV